MKRRDWLQATLTAATVATLPLPAFAAAAASPEPREPGRLPESLAGMTLAQLHDDYRDRLFQQYLPFWDKGGYDCERGGFLCELNDDGSAASDEKFIWYQGRGIWVYSFLYQNFGRDPCWLAIAQKSRDFMLRQMYAGEGKWYEKVHRDGTLIEGVGPNVYGWLFAAAGLAELYRAAGNREDLELAKRSLEAAVRAYDDPRYTDTHTALYTGVDLPKAGLRSQGHSMVIVSLLTRLLASYADAGLEKLQREHVGRIVDGFWNSQYGIVNEYLRHDYGRLPGADAHMLVGHSVESLWIVMAEALRIKDQALFDTAKSRIRRLLEMSWDYVFDGWGDGDFFVFATPGHPRGPDFDVKTMWAHCEAMVACLMIIEYTGETWAREWYERLRAFTLKTMPCAAHGVWRQAVDRRGKDLKRVGISNKRKDNFHQARYLMLNLLGIRRMLSNQGPPER